MSFVWGLILGLFVGAILAIILYPSKKPDKPSGTFVIDFSDPLKDICRLELDTDLNELYSKKQMILNIKTYGEDSLN